MPSERALIPAQVVWARASLIACLGFCIRLAFVLHFASQPLFDINLVPGTDMEYLVGWARRVAGGNLLGPGTGPFWWAPLFPYTLAGILALVGPGNLIGAVVVQAGIGALTAALVYLLGRRLLDETSGILAGLFAAAYGSAIFYTGVLLSTTLETLLAVLILYAVTGARQRPTVARWTAAGLIAGLGCLARPNFLLGAAALLAGLPMLLPRHDGRLDWRQIRASGMAFVIGLLVVLGPVTVRNGVIGGKWVLISAAGPETFRIANSYDSTPMNFVYPQQPRMPLWSVAFWRHQLRKAVVFWWGFEAPQNVNYYLARETSWVLQLPWLAFWVVVPLAAIGLWATRANAHGLLHVYLFLGAYYLSVVMFFVIARWRLPLIVPLLMFSAAGALALCRDCAAKRWRAAGAKVVVAALLALAVFPWRGPFVFAADEGQLGYILANRGRYAEAAEHLGRAADGLPSNGALQRDVGILLSRLGQPQGARQHLERAAALLPDDPPTHRELGRLLAQPGGDPVRARWHLDRFLRLAPEGTGAAEARALLQRLGEQPAAP
jgi:hypothetical protein